MLSKNAITNNGKLYQKFSLEQNDEHRHFTHNSTNNEINPFFLTYISSSSSSCFH
jgi:hypothetical protein